MQAEHADVFASSWSLQMGSMDLFDCEWEACSRNTWAKKKRSAQRWERCDGETCKVMRWCSVRSAVLRGKASTSIFSQCHFFFFSALQSKSSSREGRNKHTMAENPTRWTCFLHIFASSFWEVVIFFSPPLFISTSLAFLKCLTITSAALFF